MKTYYECIPCFVKQAMRTLSIVDKCQRGSRSSDIIAGDVREKILREVMHALGDIDFKLSPPEMARIIFDIIESHTGNMDLYKNEKERSNMYILAIYDELQMKIKKSAHPFETALRLAIAGNIIDFGAKHDFSDELIHSEIDKALSVQLKQKSIDYIKNEIEKADKILYLGDNAGEIVFDKLFIEQLPLEKITFAVRGTPIINDALIEDAEMVGMTKLVSVISNGAGLPGTVLEKCSEEFQTAFNNADLIISKGQGNYETLSESDKNIVFLLKIKCDIVARDLKGKVGDFVIKNF